MGLIREVPNKFKRILIEIEAFSEFVDYNVYICIAKKEETVPIRVRKQEWHGYEPLLISSFK